MKERREDTVDVIYFAYIIRFSYQSRKSKRILSTTFPYSHWVTCNGHFNAGNIISLEINKEYVANRETYFKASASIMLEDLNISFLSTLVQTFV